MARLFKAVTALFVAGPLIDAGSSVSLANERFRDALPAVGARAGPFTVKAANRQESE